jgi:predicted phosphodiesterase
MSSYPKGKGPTCGVCKTHAIRERGASKCGRCNKEPGWHLDDADHPTLPRGYESQWLQWQKYIGQAKERYCGPSKRPVNIGRQKILIASDFHAPFHHQEYVAAMFEREKDADLLIVGVEGNHDRPRFEKQLRDRLDKEMVDVISFLAGGNLSVIAAAARRFPNIEMVKNRIDGRFDVSWYAQVNDLIVSHMEKFSITTGSTLRGVEDWFTNFERVVGLEKDWRVIVQAHTHAGGVFPYKANKMLVESGCLCRTHGYQLTPRAGGRPQRQGYVTLTQNDGRTDVNSVRFVWLDGEDKAA